MSCTQLAENTGRKNDAKNRHLHTIAQLCRAISLQLRHVSTTGRKLVKQQCLLHVSSQYGELWPTNGWDRLTSLVHPSKFQRVSCLCFVTGPSSLNRSQPNFAQCLAISWAGILHIHFGDSCPVMEFCHVQNSLCIQVLCSPILAALLHDSPSMPSPLLPFVTKDFTGLHNLKSRALVYMTQTVCFTLSCLTKFYMRCQCTWLLNLGL